MRPINFSMMEVMPQPTTKKLDPNKTATQVVQEAQQQGIRFEKGSSVLDAMRKEQLRKAMAGAAIANNSLNKALQEHETEQVQTGTFKDGTRWMVAPGKPVDARGFLCNLPQLAQRLVEQTPVDRGQFRDQWNNPSELQVGFHRNAFVFPKYIPRTHDKLIMFNELPTYKMTDLPSRHQLKPRFYTLQDILSK